MRIVGASFNKPDKLAQWVEKEEFGFEVWSDTDKTLAEALGAGSGMVPRRVTVLLDAEGRVLLQYPEVAVGTHPGDVLADARAVLKGKK